ncbi:DNA-binding HxlR family transcriptional regulator [Nocardioides luteus]|uniref:HxlR family transcriptional regulator n=1 Tax=Nocardioides luteus TaxID=1844 RepID=A0ABQ5SRD6_9ACTN|nr:winged helix-turn-helix transcriptional regulator [Nocardioides luteus]MDR7313276.1 DNA-binding HxlR family transcriptional regulator [Nocardioides luteus]GGR42857.1 HxlR family transcriptional regulator [Nocardioides luteus]GLJ66341.1 HxlR family transcriptional regulator [Nocardioides luteus]
MTLQLSYGDLGDACAAAHALDLIGDRWSLLVVRELMFGPRTSPDLRASLNGVSTEELNDRLLFLERAGVVVETELGYITKTTAYALTEWGRELEKVLSALSLWALEGSTHYPVPSTGMTPSGVMVAMRTMVPPQSLPTETPLRAAWRLTDSRCPEVEPQQFRLDWSELGFDLDVGDLPAVDVSVAGDSTVWAGVALLGQPLDAAMATGALRVEGDRAALDRVIRVFADAMAAVG